MADKGNWPNITNVFQQAKPDSGGTLAAIWFLISRGFLILGTLKLVSLIL